MSDLPPRRKPLKLEFPAACRILPVPPKTLFGNPTGSWTAMDRPAPFQRKPGPMGPSRGPTEPPEKFNIWSGKKIGREELAAKVRE